MSDTFGAMPIPLVAPATGESAGDPLLSTTLSFFKAVLNANASAAWRAVYKDVANAPVVKTTLDDDPRGSTFNDNDLPALFLWREDVKEPVWIADDWLTQESVCRLMWVLPAGVQVKRALRSSIINGVVRTLVTFVERNRDPSWIVAGDTDPKAATLGSSFFDRAGWIEFHVGAWKPFNLPIAMLDKGAAPRMYDAVSVACRVVERLNFDLTRLDPNGGVSITLRTPDGGVGDGGVVTARTILP
jgi:hypothetical protein